MSLGFGHAPIGGSHMGFGTPTTVNSSAARLFIKRDGTQGNCALIDPKTGDRVVDEYGNTVGDDSINQKVYLALITIYNSSSVSNFGLQLDITNSVINDSTQFKMKLAVLKALKHLTDPKLITVVDVIIKKFSSTGIETTVEWRNNLTGENQFTSF